MAKRHRRTSYHGCGTSSQIGLILGLVLGYLIGSVFRFTFLPCVRFIFLEHHLTDLPFIDESSPDERSLLERGIHNTLHNTKYGNANITTDTNLVLIGVMTAKTFLDSRVISCHETWATSIPGKVIFFSSEGSEKLAPSEIPVVGLTGVDDSYPPQRKSFMMLKYMHDHFLNKFKFFMRADDDVYVRGEVLSHLLHSINTTNRALFIGQAGLGNKDEFGQLSLKESENFCMGGTSMILSRETLIRTIPHIDYCLNNLYTTHEDVEVGRCISRFANVSCTWAYEVRSNGIY